MIVYRIAKTKERSTDLSGTGAFKAGGRWNNTGVFAVYTSESQALAMLEMLVHAEESELPPDLYVITIEINDSAPVYNMRDKLLPKDWRAAENIKLKNTGDKILQSKKHIAIRVRSAVMPEEYNLVLNPLYPDFRNLIKIIRTDMLEVDKRL